jgi:hypothetical protein
MHACMSDLSLNDTSSVSSCQLMCEVMRSSKLTEVCLNGLQIGRQWLEAELTIGLEATVETLAFDYYFVLRTFVLPRIFPVFSSLILVSVANIMPGLPFFVACHTTSYN